MKFPRYLLISTLLLLVANSAYACWSPWHPSHQYYMFRVYEEQTIPEENGDEEYERRLNCQEWQRLTSRTIPLEDIYHIVYKMPLEEYQALYDRRTATDGNRFAQWITKRDTAILDFLLLAKTNEYIRLQHNSRWYYPSMKIGGGMTLEEIAERSIAAKDKRLRDRYLLQGIRALFSLGRYQECIALWEREASLLPEENLMRQMIQPYIAGAEFRIKRTEKAVEYFAEIGDVESVQFCIGSTGEKLSTIEALKLVCQYSSDSRYIAKTLQSLVRSIEPDGDFYRYYEFELKPEHKELYRLCIKMGESGRGDNAGMWYYTAAYLAYLDKDTQKASQLLALAERSKASDLIKGSIKVFRIYLDAKLSTYDSTYEKRLFSQLKWLDAKICDNIDDRVRSETAQGYKLKSGVSYYYWNDMLRRILLSEVCPGMIEVGKTTRALQLANMADNRLLGLVGKMDYHQSTYTLSAFRYSDNFNNLDYSNHFFEMIDSMDVAATRRYVENIKSPKSEFDRFLNARGYTGDDYLNDILGTQYLRNMEYDQALKYLGKVSEAFKNHLNVYMIFDPFSLERIAGKTKYDFRYEFAAHMHSLEQTIQLTKDPNRKARLILKYAIGLHNSFDKCWELTQYYQGSTYWGQVCEKREWEKDQYTLAAKARAKELIETACRIPTDEETAADIHYQLHRYCTIAEKYPHTQKGLLVKGQCDNLVDYEVFRPTYSF